MNKNADSTVFVIDDDESIREALKSLIRSVGLGVETFGSAQDFLQSKRPDVPACLILDVRMPGLSGLVTIGNADGQQAVEAAGHQRQLQVAVDLQRHCRR